MKEVLHQAISLSPNERIAYLKENNIMLEDLVKLIGHEDAVLREGLVYRIFVEALFANSFTNEEKQQLLLQLSSPNYLFKQIGEVTGESVFTRSYSALWISQLLKSNQQQSFIDVNDLIEVLETISTYLIEEKDSRGFLEEKGWAAAIRHAGEMYNVALFDSNFKIQFIPKLLQGITNALWRNRVFVDDEDQILASFVKGMHFHEYPEEVLVEWIEQLFDKLTYHSYNFGYSEEYYKAKTNTIHLMQCIYFQCKFNKIYPKVQSTASYFIAKNF